MVVPQATLPPPSTSAHDGMTIGSEQPPLVQGPPAMATAEPASRMLVRPPRKPLNHTGSGWLWLPAPSVMAETFTAVKYCAVVAALSVTKLSPMVTVSPSAKKRRRVLSQ